MQTDILIIGQGICGTWLSWYLEQAGVAHIVIDEPRTYTASKAAAGLINPVTGRRIVKTWMIDELMPFVQDAYRQIGDSFGISCIQRQMLIDFFPTPQMRMAFLKRYDEDPEYLQLPAGTARDEHAWDEYFRYDFGFGMINPCYLIDLQTLLAAGRKRLVNRQSLLEERFDSHGLTVGESGPIRYKDITAEKVIFCDGIESFGNPYFSLLPFAPNKGEALIVEIPDLPHEAGTNKVQSGGPSAGGTHAEAYIFKKGISLIPWKEGLYWAGSSYEWSFDHVQPTEAFRARTVDVLQSWLKQPFKTVEHFASVRPASLERRPFVGFHPRYTAIGILNGMGTKGCSLAPYFARQLTEYITKGTPIQPDADIKRFSRVLNR